MADPRKVRADAKALVSELLERLARDEVRELEVKRGGVRVRVAKDGGPVPARVAGGAIPAGAEVNGPATGAELPTVSAPLTGVFYRSPSPQAQPYVQVGSEVGVGEVIGEVTVDEVIADVEAGGAELAGLSSADASAAVCATHSIALAPAKIAPTSAPARASRNRRFIASLPASFPPPRRYCERAWAPGQFPIAFDMPRSSIVVAP